MKTVDPLGAPSLEKSVDPLEASKRLLPEETAENVLAVTPLPQVNDPPLTPQLPLEDVILKLELVPVIVYVANVCVDHVAAERRPPRVEPSERMAWIVAFEGRLPGEPVGPEPPPVVVDVPPDFRGYLIPLEGQLPASGADMATKLPSIIDPFKLKYHSIAFNVLPSQFRAGVNPPDSDFKAEVSCDRVNVLEELGVMPWLDSQV